jgi:hypothetical protein
MKKTILYISLIVLNGICMNTFAQKDSLDDGLTVNIKYVPTLSESIKIPVNPNPEQPTSVKPTFTYKIPDLNTFTTPTIYTIKPLSLGNALLPKLSNNYFRFGFGNYITPLAEGYINSLRNKTWNNGIFFKHLSSEGDQAFQNFSNNTIAAHSKRFFDKSILSTSVLYHRNVVNNYGYLVPDSLIANKDTLKNIYNLFDLNISLENLKNDTVSLAYKFDLNYYFQNNNYDLVEHNFKLAGTLAKTISNMPFTLYTGINSMSNISNSNTLQRTAFIFNPRINLEDELFYIKAGFNFTYFTDSLDNANPNHFYPVGEAAYHVIPKALTVLAGINGRYNINTFRSINAENPFVRNYIFKNTNNKFEMYGGLKGHIAKGLNFSLQGSIANISNMLFYVGDSSGKQRIIYDEKTITLTTFTADISYQVGDKWRLGLISKLYNYSMGQLQYAYSRPSSEVKLNSTFNIGDKFLLRADVFYVGERKGGTYDRTNGNKDDVYEIKLDPFVDMNIGLDYRYNKNVSVFFNFNNMAAARYMRYTNLDVYGFNALGGVSLTF